MSNFNLNLNNTLLTGLFFPNSFCCTSLYHLFRSIWMLNLVVNLFCKKIFGCYIGMMLMRFYFVNIWLLFVFLLLYFTSNDRSLRSRNTRRFCCKSIIYYCMQFVLRVLGCYVDLSYIVFFYHVIDGNLFYRCFIFRV